VSASGSEADIPLRGGPGHPAYQAGQQGLKE
jgi:hypothetical protein